MGTKDWDYFKFMSRESLGNLSRKKEWRKFFGFISRAVDTLSSVYGFTILEVISEGSEKPGVILFSPDGNELYREVPREKGWKYSVLKEALKYNVQGTYTYHS